MLKSIWMHGLQLRSCTKKTNIKFIQSSEKKALREIVDTPCYVRKDNIDIDLKIDSVYEHIKIMNRLELHH